MSADLCLQANKEKRAEYLQVYVPGSTTKKGRKERIVFGQSDASGVVR
jgi:hypothetical protein